VPEVSRAAQPKALSGSSVSGDFAIDLCCVALSFLFGSFENDMWMKWSDSVIIIDGYGWKKEKVKMLTSRST